MSKRTAWVLAAGVAAVAVGAAAVGAVALVVRAGGRPPGGWAGGTVYLAINVQGELPERPSHTLSGLLGTPRPSLRGLVESVDRAAADSQVRGLVLCLLFPQSSDLIHFLFRGRKRLEPEGSEIFACRSRASEELDGRRL